MKVMWVPYNADAIHSAPPAAAGGECRGEPKESQERSATHSDRHILAVSVAAYVFRTI